MRNLITGFSFLFLIFSASASDQMVSFGNGSVNAHISWKVGPQSGKESLMNVDLKSAETLNPVDLKVSLFMPDMGHGSSPTKVEKMGTNQFRVSKVYFTMPGLWEVRLTLISSDGQKETKTFSVNI